MNTYRVWFAFGDDEEYNRCNIIDAENRHEAISIMIKRLADDPEGFIIGEVEQLYNH